MMGKGGHGISGASLVACLACWRSCTYCCQKSCCCAAPLLYLMHAGNVARILGAGAASTIGVNGLAEQLAKGR